MSKKRSGMVVKGSRHSYRLPGDPGVLAKMRQVPRRMWDEYSHLKVSTRILLEKQHANKRAFSGPLFLEAAFYLPTKDVRGRRKLGEKQKPHVVRPDITDLVKFLEEVGSGIIFSNVCHIAGVHAYKVYDDEPRIEFSLVELA